MRIPITIYPPHICIPKSACHSQYKIIKNFPQNSMQLTNIKKDGLAVFISEYKRKQTHINTPIHITMTQADAKEQGYKQGQKVILSIPYKNIIIPKVKIKIKDYFLLDVFIMQDQANTLNIENGDRATIIKER